MFQAGAVGLPQGGRRQRFFLEDGEDFFQRFAQITLGCASDILKGFWGYFILQAGQLSGELGRQDIHPG